MIKSQYLEYFEGQEPLIPYNFKTPAEWDILGYVITIEIEILCSLFTFKFDAYLNIPWNFVPNKILERKELFWEIWDLLGTLCCNLEAAVKLEIWKKKSFLKQI